MSIKPAVKAITPAEFSRLTPPEQLDVLRGQDARQKTRLLLDAVNGAELMAQLSTQEVYLLVMERGPEFLPELLGMASPEQWTGLIDLDCWQGDRFDAEKARRWLEILLENDDQTIVAILQRINFEQLILICKSEMEIVSGPESIEDDDKRVEAVKRDGGYQINYRSSKSAKLFESLLEHLHASDPQFFLYLLEAIRAETMSLIEESVYQQRAARMLDMGIPDPLTARKVYAWLDPERFRQQAPTKHVPGEFAGCAPGFLLTLSRPGGLFGKILTEGLEEVMAWELAGLVNKVIMADGVDLANSAAVGQTIDKVNGYLNLALTWLCGDDVAAARERLQTTYWEDLFRVGYSLTLRLQKRARVLAGTTLAAYLDDKARACLKALLETPPRLFEGVMDATRAGTRHFSEPAEIDAVSRWLARIELQRSLFEDGLPFALPEPAGLDLTGCTPESADDLSLVEFFLTALSNKLLGGDLLPLPIAEEDLAALHGMVCQAGGIRPRLREETVKWLESQVPGGGEFAHYCLDIWAEEFCAIALEDLDPRFVGGLIIRLQTST